MVSYLLLLFGISYTFLVVWTRQKASITWGWGQGACREEPSSPTNGWWTWSSAQKSVHKGIRCRKILDKSSCSPTHQQPWVPMAGQALDKVREV